MFKADSFREVGTLYQLKNVLNRANVVQDQKNDFHACSDFFQTIVESYIISATLKTFGMTTLSDEPSHSLLPLADSDENNRRVALYRAMKEVIARHVTK